MNRNPFRFNVFYHLKNRFSFITNILQNPFTKFRFLSISCFVRFECLRICVFSTYDCNECVYCKHSINRCHHHHHNTHSTRLRRRRRRRWRRRRSRRRRRRINPIRIHSNRVVYVLIRHQRHHRMHRVMTIFIDRLDWSDPIWRWRQHLHTTHWVLINTDIWWWIPIGILGNEKLKKRRRRRWMRGRNEEWRDGIRVIFHIERDERMRVRGSINISDPLMVCTLCSLLLVLRCRAIPSIPRFVCD